MSVRRPSVATAASPFLASSTSALVMRPPGPVPVMPPRSMPSAAATRAATGEILASSGISAGARGAVAGAPLPDDSGAAGLGAVAPTCMRAMTWPTVTVSPSSARISVIVPAAGAGSSMSTLSVESSTTVWPSSTASPTLTAHSRIVPSVTDSPPVGVTMSTTSPVGAAAGSGAAGAAGASASGSSASDSAAAGAAPLSVTISASTAPTLTVSPSAARILATVPLAGAGTSASTLSVEISTRTSSASTRSPSCLCHSRTVPSVTDSPICGRVTCTVVLTAMSLKTDCSARAEPGSDS